MVVEHQMVGGGSPYSNSNGRAICNDTLLLLACVKDDKVTCCKVTTGYVIRH